MNDIHNTNVRQSNICVSILTKILDFVSIKNDEIMIRGENLIIEEKKMLVYGKDAIKKRRKNKNDFDYFNPYSKQNHFEFIINLIMEVEDIESIGIETDGIVVYYNENIKEGKILFNKEDFDYKDKILNALIHHLDV